ncbi:hypothetical protein Tco_0066137 [Tanacetum coccineum]
MKFASSQDDCLYFVDHTDEMVQEQLAGTLDPDRNWIDNEEEDKAEEVQAISFYLRKEPVEPLEWKILENRLKPSVDRPLKVELKALPDHLDYAFLQADEQLLVVISSSLSALEKVSPVQVVQKKGGMTVVRNEKNKLIPQCTVTGCRVCIDYRKLNDATRKYHFPLPSIDQMLERLTGIVLGHKISHARIEVDRVKIEAMSKFPHLTNVKSIRSFLGHARSTKALIMVKLDWSLPFKLMCDASDFMSSSGGTLVVSVGGLLRSEARLDINWRLVSFSSRGTFGSRSEVGLVAIGGLFGFNWRLFVLSEGCSSGRWDPTFSIFGFFVVRVICEPRQSKVIPIGVFHLEGCELKTLIATYDIPLDLRPRLPDSNFRMINLPAGDTAIGIYFRIFDSFGVRIPFSSFLLAVLKYFRVHISQLVPLGLSNAITFEVLCRSLSIEPTVTLFRVFQTLSKQGDWFSFAKHGGSAHVCMEVTKSRLKQWKEKIFLIDRRAIPFHMPWRHPDSCITDKVPTSFNQDHVDRLKAHIVKLRDISEGVLDQSRLSRVWCNPMCDPVLRLMSIYDFLCMPSLEKATVREEPHELGTSILGRVADRTTPPAPTVTKADHAAKQKTSTGLEISTNTTKRTRLSQKVSGTGSSMLVAEDGVKQTDDGTLDDDGQRDGSEFSMEDIGNLNDIRKSKLMLSCTRGLRRITQASSHASHGVSEDASSLAQEAVAAPDTQPLDTNAGADEIASDGNVDPYFDACVSNTAGDVLERDLLPFVLGPYYIPYPFDEGSGIESPPYTRDDWEEIHEVNLAETHRLRELSSVELSDRMSVLQCQLITHGSMLNARYDHSLKNVERLTKRCAQQTHIIKKKSTDLKQHKESTVYANQEVSGLKAELGHAEEIQGSISSFFQSDFTPLVRRFLESSKFNRAFADVLNTAISVGVEHGLRMDRTDDEFRGLSQEVAGFIPDAKEKFDRVIAAFPDTTFPFLDKPSFATASLRTNTHVRHSTSSSETFGHTSTLEHLKKKRSPLKKKALSALRLDLYGSDLLSQHGLVLPQQLSGCSPCARARGKPTLAVSGLD